MPEVSEPVSEAPKKRSRASPGEEESRLIVAKAVREYLKQLPVPAICGAEMLGAVNAKLQSLLAEAASKAHENGRKTLKPSDL
jgi:histone H3/H4